MCGVFSDSAQFGGNNRARTYDPLLVRQMLSQLSYAPIHPIFQGCCRGCERFAFEPLSSTDLFILHLFAVKVKGFFEKNCDLLLLHILYDGVLCLICAMCNIKQAKNMMMLPCPVITYNHSLLCESGTLTVILQYSLRFILIFRLTDLSKGRSVLY